ncbi:MAG: hemolysin family protein [candidate division WOR-3 bacterium]|nr:hemolysin family protein [candidate division WOR-3 bacterium]MCX7836925.1 hemolysin family protein [candidate division WOR-3 bacterium]MDW8114589.1 hemolysin family protein [candidate division WOR-3 bacterium]
MEYLIIVLLILLLLSALFSASETAFFSLSLEDFKKLKIEELKKNEFSFLLILLLANLLVNISFTSLATLFSINLFSNKLQHSLLLTLTSITITFIILLFGEILPKIYTTYFPLKIANFSLPHFKRISSFLNPFSQYFQKIFIFRFLPKKEPFPSKEELKALINFGIENNELTKEEGEILYNLIELEERRVNEIMTPRNKMFVLNQELSIKEALEKIKENPKSRIPIYENNIDNIIGVVYLKDILELSLIYHFNPPKDLKLKNIKKPISFVSEVQRLPIIFEELRKKGSHIALVIDEFGQISGLITLEDFLEAIFGEIKDEYDFEEPLPYIKIDENSYLISGDIDIATVNRLTQDTLKDVNFPRLSAYLVEKLGRLPQVGDIIKEKNLLFEIKEIKERKIEKVLLKIL